jgi:2-polyprenyl-3-methyl-5-hydroxy-6-metoxy-1,4-benzoquinol methylase
MTELRYGFGKNWAEFIERKLSDEIVEQSVEHLKSFMKVDTLEGKTFLDIGCGSGIHSLAALRLGAAKVTAFDYDQDSVATSRQVREWAGIPETRWSIGQGSVLDTAFMSSLPKSDIVYSWGVLHHTGAMWDAVRNATIPIKKGGEFYIALYSSDNYVDPTPEFWIRLKRAYNQADPMTRTLMELKYVYWILIRPEIEAGRDPLNLMANYGKRGMTAWTDAKDWMGGYPMEFASYAETCDFCKATADLDLVNVLTGEGCTEYLFARPPENKAWRDVETQRQRIPMPGPFAHAGGHAYAINLPAQLAQSADDNADHMRSRVMVYEDGRPLGIAHCMHDTIRNIGKGRFSHWGNDLVFSTPDNSDPNANGRTYAYCEAY